jgi:hypothetical protein
MANYESMLSYLLGGGTEEIQSIPGYSEVMEKLERIERKLDLIFGNYVVINGKLVDPLKLSRP